jgi:hypothetical protein
MCRAQAENGGRRCSGAHGGAGTPSERRARRRAAYMANSLGRTRIDPRYAPDPVEAPDLQEEAYEASVRDAEFANGQTPVDDADGDLGVLIFDATGQPLLAEEDDVDVANVAADAALAAEVAEYETHKALVEAEMAAADATYAAQEAARVYDPPVAGLHSRTDPMGNTMWAADRAWSRDLDGTPWHGLTLMDEGETTPGGAAYFKRSDATVRGFRDQRGGEWVAVGRGSDRDPDGSGRYTPANWEITEVTGRYAQGLKDANGGEVLSFRRFHRGPVRVSTPATVKVAAELGPRWTPAYMETSMHNQGNSQFDEWIPCETITLVSETGDVLVTKRHTYADSSSKNGQAGVGLKLARKAGWTDVLHIRVNDATFAQRDGARIPVSIKSADAFAEWLGDSGANIPTMEWLDGGGLKTQAGIAAVGRQLMGPAAA